MVPDWLGAVRGWGRSRRGEKSEVLAPKTKPIFGNPASRQKQSREERNFLPLAKQSVRIFQMGKGEEEEEEEKLQPKKGAPRDRPLPFLARSRRECYITPRATSATSVAHFPSTIPMDLHLYLTSGRAQWTIAKKAPCCVVPTDKINLSPSPLSRKARGNKRGGGTGEACCLH